MIKGMEKIILVPHEGSPNTNIANYLPVVKSAAAGVCSMYQWCKIRGVTKNVEIESMYTPEVKERTLQHTDYTLYTGFMGRFSAT